MAQQSVEIRRHQHRATFAARCEVSARDFEWRRHNGLECSTEPCAELKAVQVVSSRRLLLIQNEVPDFARKVDDGTFECYAADCRPSVAAGKLFPK